MTTHDVKITKIVRLTNSALGNPRWALIAQNGGRFKTSDNAALGYIMENLRNAGYIDEHNPQTIRLHTRGSRNERVFQITDTNDEYIELAQ